MGKIKLPAPTSVHRSDAWGWQKIEEMPYIFNPLFGNLIIPGLTSNMI